MFNQHPSLPVGRLKRPLQPHLHAIDFDESPLVDIRRHKEGTRASGHLLQVERRKFLERKTRWFALLLICFWFVFKQRCLWGAFYFLTVGFFLCLQWVWPCFCCFLPFFSSSSSLETSRDRVSGHPPGFHPLRSQVTALFFIQFLGNNFFQQPNHKQKTPFRKSLQNPKLDPLQPASLDSSPNRADSHLPALPILTRRGGNLREPKVATCSRGDGGG